MRRLCRFLVTCIATAIVVAGAYGGWTYGLDRFDDGYCETEVEIPRDAGSRVPAPEWEPPLTYRCDFGPGGEVTNNEPRPILWTGAVLGVALLAVSALWWRLATRSAGPEYEGKHRA